MIILDLFLFILNRSFLFHVSNDKNFDTLEYKKNFCKDYKRYRYSLLQVNLGDKQLYIFTYCKEEGVSLYYFLKLPDLTVKDIDRKLNELTESLEDPFKESESSKCLADFFKEKLSQENTRISYSMSKLTSYRSFLLFLVAAGVPLFNYFITKYDAVWLVVTFYFVYYVYCYYLFAVISSAISVSSVSKSTSGQFNWNKYSNKALAQAYAYDLISSRSSADKKVSLVKGAEKYLKTIFLMMLISVFSYIIPNTMKTHPKAISDEYESFSIFDNEGDFNIVAFSNFTASLVSYKGDINVLHCFKSKKKVDIEKIFLMFELNHINIKFVDVKDNNFCRGLTVIHF